MTTTERLRELLDERGVEWQPGDSRIFRDSITYWTVGKIRWSAIEGNDGLVLNNIELDRLTPEQVIADTLGAGTCKRVFYEPTGVYICSECGLGLSKKLDKYCFLRFCPNCGRKVVDE